MKSTKSIRSELESRVLQALEDAGVIYNEPVVGTSGGSLPYYVDIKMCYGDANFREDLARLVWRSSDGYNLGYTCVAASGYGGIPLAQEISSIFKIPLVMVRDSPRKHGTRNMIDGYIPDSEDFLLVVDDVKTTGNSLCKIRDALNVKPVMYCVLVDRSPELACPVVPFKAVFRADELL